MAMKNSPCILFLSYDGMTDPLGQSQVIPYLAGLVARNFTVHLISFEKPEAASHQNQLAFLLKEAGISWHPLAYTKRPPVLSTLYDIYQLQKKAEQLHRQHHFSVIHCRSYIAALVGLSMKRKLEVKFLFDMRGFWADERIDGGLWNLENPLYRTIYRFFKRKEISFLKEADAIISLTQNGKTELLSWPVAKQHKLSVEVIPCCVDLSLFDPEKVAPVKQDVWRAKLQLQPTDWVLSYLGSVGTWYMLPEMLDFFALLLKQKPTAKFLFISGENPAYIRQVATEKGIPGRAIVVQKAARQEVPELISLSNASIFFIKPVFSKKASSPTKQGELMAMGVPVICNAGVGDTDYVVNKYGAGVLVHEFSEVAYGQALAQLQASGETDRQKLRKGATEYFSLERGIEKYYNTYQSILPA